MLARYLFFVDFTAVQMHWIDNEGLSIGALGLQIWSVSPALHLVLYSVQTTESPNLRMWALHTVHNDLTLVPSHGCTEWPHSALYSVHTTQWRSPWPTSQPRDAATVWPSPARPCQGTSSAPEGVTVNIVYTKKENKRSQWTLCTQKDGGALRLLTFFDTRW